MIQHEDLYLQSDSDSLPKNTQLSNESSWNNRILDKINDPEISILYLKNELLVRSSYNARWEVIEPKWEIFLANWKSFNMQSLLSYWSVFLRFFMPK